MYDNYISVFLIRRVCPSLKIDMEELIGQSFLPHCNLLLLLLEMLLTVSVELDRQEYDSYDYKTYDSISAV